MSTEKSEPLQEPLEKVTQKELHGVVKKVDGKVEIINEDGSRQTLKEGDEVKEGSQVVTGENAHVILQFANGGECAINPGTQIPVSSTMMTPKAEVLPLTPDHATPEQHLTLPSQSIEKAIDYETMPLQPALANEILYPAGQGYQCINLEQEDDGFSVVNNSWWAVGNIFAGWASTTFATEFPPPLEIPLFKPLEEAISAPPIVQIAATPPIIETPVAIETPAIQPPPPPETPPVAESAEASISSIAFTFEDGQPFQNVGNLTIFPAAINVSFTPADNEVLDSITFHNIPIGATISDGIITVIGTGSNDFTVLAGNIPNLTYIPAPDNLDVDQQIPFTATFHDPDSGLVVNINSFTPVIIDAVADLPTNAVSLGTGLTACLGEVWSIGGNFTGPGGLPDHTILYQINLDTGTATQVGAITVPDPNSDFEALDFNPADGFLYGLASNGNANELGLVKINPGDATAIFLDGNVLSNSTNLAGFSFDTSGVLYAVVKDGGNSILSTIDITNGASTPVGPNNGEITLNGMAQDFGGLAIDPVNNVFYGVGSLQGNDTLFILNSANATIQDFVEITIAGNPNPNLHLESLEFDGAGTLWAIDRVSGGIYTINPNTGVAELHSTTLGTSGQTGDGFESLAIGTALEAGSNIPINLSATFNDLDGSEDHYFLVQLPDGWSAVNATSIVVNPDGVPAGTYALVDVADNLANVTATLNLTAPSNITSDTQFTINTYAVAHEVNLSGQEITLANNLAVTPADTLQVTICPPPAPPTFDLGVEKTVDGDFCIGDTITYTITISNAPANTAVQDIFVHDMFPDQYLKFLSSSATLGSYDSVSHTWSLNGMSGLTLQPNQIETLTITAQILPQPQADFVETVGLIGNGQNPGDLQESWLLGVGHTADAFAASAYNFGEAFVTNAGQLIPTGTGTFTFDPDGMGVAGNYPGGASPNQIGFNPNTGQTEALQVSLDGHEANSATIYVSHLFLDEQQGEYGKVTAFDATGKSLGSIFFGETQNGIGLGSVLSDGSTFVDVNYNNGSDNVGNFTITADMFGCKEFSYLVFSAIPYGSTVDAADITTDSSDYYLQAITYTQNLPPAAITNTVDIITNQPGMVDSNPNNNTFTVTFQPTEADLCIQKTFTSGDLDCVTTGSPITYTITVTNVGFGNATTIAISDLLPVGLDFVSQQSSVPATFTDLNDALSWVLTNPLAHGQSATFTVNTIVDLNDGEGIDLQHLANTATVTSDCDVDLANNSSTVVLNLHEAQPVNGTISAISLTYEDGQPNQNIGDTTIVPAGISINFVPADNEIVNSITFLDIPNGATISDGINTLVGDGSADFTVLAANFANLTYIPAADNLDVDQAINFVANISDPDNPVDCNISANINGVLNVTIDAVADLPTGEAASFGALTACLDEAWSIGGRFIGGAGGIDANSVLYKINLDTGFPDQIAAISVTNPNTNTTDSNPDFEALDFNTADGFLYGLNSNGNPDTKGLVKIDPTNGVTTWIGGDLLSASTNVAGFSFNNEGVLYAVVKNSGDSILYTVDLTNGLKTLVGNTMDNTITGLAIDPVNDAIYGVGDGAMNHQALFLLDPTDGHILQTINLNATSTHLESLEFDGAGTLWAIDRTSGEIFIIDPTTGVATVHSTTLSTGNSGPFGGQTGDGFESLAIGNALAAGSDVPIHLSANFNDLDGSEDHYFLVQLPDGWSAPNATIVVNPDGVPAGTYVLVDIADSIPTATATLELQAPSMLDSDTHFTINTYAVAHEINLNGQEITLANNLAVTDAEALNITICAPEQAAAVMAASLFAPIVTDHSNDGVAPTDNMVASTTPSDNVVPSDTPHVDDPSLNNTVVPSDTIVVTNTHEDSATATPPADDGSSSVNNAMGINEFHGTDQNGAVTNQPADDASVAPVQSPPETPNEVILSFDDTSKQIVFSDGTNNQQPGDTITTNNTVVPSNPSQDQDGNEFNAFANNHQIDCGQGSHFDVDGKLISSSFLNDPKHEVDTHNIFADDVGKDGDKAGTYVIDNGIQGAHDFHQLVFSALSNDAALNAHLHQDEAGNHYSMQLEYKGNLIGTLISNAAHEFLSGADKDPFQNPHEHAIKANGEEQHKEVIFAIKEDGKDSIIFDTAKNDKNHDNKPDNSHDNAKPHLDDSKALDSQHQNDSSGGHNNNVVQGNDHHEGKEQPLTEAMLFSNVKTQNPVLAEAQSMMDGSNQPHEQMQHQAQQQQQIASANCAGGSSQMLMDAISETMQQQHHQQHGGG